MSKILRRVDQMCGADRITRADVLCELVRALLRGRATGAQRPAPSPQEKIMRAMRRSGSMTVRELKTRTASTRISANDWDRALQDLITSGTLSFHLGGKTGRRKVVSLPAISGVDPNE